MIGWDGGRGGVKEMGAGYICVSQERYIAGYVGGGGCCFCGTALLLFVLTRRLQSGSIHCVARRSSIKRISHSITTYE